MPKHNFKTPRRQGTRFLMTIVDLLLILLVAFLGITGFEHFIGVESIPAATSSSSQVSGESGRMDDLTAERDRLEAEAARLDKQLNDKQDAGVERGPSNDHDHATAALTDSLHRMQARLAQLDRDAKSFADQAADLEKHLRVVRDTLVSAGQEAASVPVQDVVDGMTPIFFALKQGRVVPLASPYYTIENRYVETDAGYVSCLLALRQRRGDPPAEATRAGSPFHTIIDTLDTNERYVALLVDPESFDGFRALRQYLREQAIPFGWEPTDVDTLILVSSGGRNVAQEIGNGG